MVSEVKAVSSRVRSHATSERVRPPMLVRAQLVRARSARSKATWGLGLGIKSEGRVFGFDGAVGCNLGVIPGKWCYSPIVI
jgi:hypothetical protein